MGAHTWSLCSNDCWYSSDDTCDDDTFGDSDTFGDDAFGTCGLQQLADFETRRHATATRALSATRRQILPDVP